MESQAPKYRVSTVEAVRKSEVALAFRGHLSEAGQELQVWLCGDGTQLVFHPSANPEKFFVEFRCQFRAEPAGVVNYGLLPKAIEFCRAHGGKLKVMRSGSVLPASGCVYSDVFCSQANRVVQHLAQHPKDQAAVVRLSKGAGV